MFDRLLGWIGLGRKSVFASWLIARGGTLSDLKERVKTLEAFGGAWSFTFTIDEKDMAEIHLLQVVMAKPLWKKGFKKPTKNAPDVAQVDRKAIYKGPFEEFPMWLEGLKGEMVAEKELQDAALDEFIDGGCKLEVVKEGGASEEESSK